MQQDAAIRCAQRRPRVSYTSAATPPLRTLSANWGLRVGSRMLPSSAHCVAEAIEKREHRFKVSWYLCGSSVRSKIITARRPPRLTTMVSTPPPESQSHGRRQLRSKQPPLLACGGTYANTSDVPVYQDVQGSTTYYPPIFADAPAELAAQLPPPAYGHSSACTSDVRVYQDAQGRTT